MPKLANAQVIESSSHVRRWQGMSLKAQNNIRGLFWKLVACFAFACVNSLVRYLTGGAGISQQPLPTEVIVCFQNIFGLVLLMPLMLKDGIGTFKTSWPLVHTVRIIIAVAGIICLYSAFASMPMAQAVALQFTGPVFAVIGAKLYLKEKMGFYRLSGVILGLLGAFIITRPDKAFMHDTGLSWIMMLPLLSALAFAVVKILSRELALKGESAQLLTTYLILFMVPASLVPALAVWVTPGPEALLLLVALGGVGSLAHFATAKAFTYADVTFLTPFGFARIIFTAFLGYILYAELPTNSNLWVGFSIIMASTILISLGERVQVQEA